MRRKCAAVCQTIIVACSLRFYISPPLLALATFVHKKHGLRELIDTFNTLVLDEKLVNALLL